MLKISARSKLINLQNSVKLYYVLAIGGFVTTLTFVLYRDLIVSATMLVSTIAAFVILGRPPLNIVVEMDSESISMGDEKIKWTDCTAWSLSDLGENLEFTIQTTQFSQQFYYFYLHTEQPGASEVISTLANYLPYSEEVAGKNLVHTIMCILGLR